MFELGNAKPAAISLPDVFALVSLFVHYQVSKIEAPHASWRIGSIWIKESIVYIYIFGQSAILFTQAEKYKTLVQMKPKMAGVKYTWRNI